MPEVRIKSLTITKSKTVLAKVLALESGLPIVVVNGEYPARCLNKFFKEFKTPVCVLFDEVEKNWDTEKMLEFLDGVQSTAKKLVLMTCNSLSKVSEYMQDRCSRIRYLRKYGADENIELVDQLVQDFEIKNPEEVSTFIKTRIQLMSMDNICSFLQEVKTFEEANFTLEELLEVMNISPKGSPIIESDIENIEDDNNDYGDDEYCEPTLMNSLNLE